MSVFEEMGNYWAEIADQNSTIAQIQFLKNILRANALVLDLACGNGRHSICLSNEGYKMVGLDLSLNLLKIAKNQSGNLQLVRADMRFLPFKAETFSAAFSMDTSFGYLPSEQDDMQNLIELQKLLSKEGILVIDVFNRERLILKHKPNRRKNLKWTLLPVLLKPNRLARWGLFRFFKWKEYASFFLLQKQTISPDCNKLYDLWVVRDKTGGQVKVFEHRVRLYESDLLQTLLTKTGFTVKVVYGGYKNEVYSSESNRLILVAEVKPHERSILS